MVGIPAGSCIQHSSAEAAACTCPMQSHSLACESSCPTCTLHLTHLQLQQLDWRQLLHTMLVTPSSTAPCTAGPAAAAAIMSRSNTCCCYFPCQTRSADPGCRPMVAATLDALAALGASSTTTTTSSSSPLDGRGLVVRTWAFNDGPGWMSLQPQPGEVLAAAAGGGGSKAPLTAHHISRA
jgi:hypothetical protein